MRFLAIASMVAIGAHAVLLTLLHVLAPEVDPLSDMLGAYLGTGHASLARATFLAFSVNFGCLAAALVLVGVRGVAARLGVASLALAAVGFLLVFSLPEYGAWLARPTRPLTVLGTLFVGLGVRRLPRFRAVRVPLVAAPSVMLALFVGTIVLGVVEDAGLGGLANRVVVLLIYVWSVSSASRMVRDPD